MKCRSALFFRTAVCCASLCLLIATATPARAASGDPPSRVARLAQIAAQVALEPAGTDQWTQGLANTPLTTGDRLYVNHEGHAELQMGEIAVRLWRFTDLTVVNLSNDVTQLGVAQGSVHVRTFGLHADKPVEVDTPNGAITVLQPGDFRLDVYTNAGGTLVAVDSGAIQISGPGVEKVLGAGQSVHLVGSHPIQVLPQRLPGKDPFDVWSRQRDRAFLASESHRYVNPDTIGIEDLDAFGTWSDTLEYGPVWYPSNLPAGWSPYSNGRWNWIAPWGWTWVDADAWGFAPFHYGQWTDLGARWGWIPGPSGAAPVYAPAMVAFLNGVRSSAAGGAPLAAWFPLAAGEPFYPAYTCSAACFTQVNLSNVSEPRSNPRRISASTYYSYYHSRTGFRSIHFAHQKAATIAVPASTLASGESVTPERVVHGIAAPGPTRPISSHPLIAPTLKSVLPLPLNQVSVPAARPLVLVASRSGDQAAAQSGVQESAPPVEERFHLIARTVPPAAGSTLEQQLPALRQNMGRPLDPLQFENGSAGRPAGAVRAPEFPPDDWTPSRRAARQ